MTDALSDLAPDRPRFDHLPDFEPDFSAMRMAALGVFDGGYFHGEDERQTAGIDRTILDAGALFEKPDVALNLFGKHSGLTRAEWIARGWIHPRDPLGWYQWYCRLCSGRTSDDDPRQAKRWREFRARWRPKTVRALENMRPGAGTRQALIQWAIDPYLPEQALGIEVGSR